MVGEWRGSSVFSEVLGKSEAICRVFPSQVLHNNLSIVEAVGSLRFLGLPQEAALTELKM